MRILHLARTMGQGGAEKIIYQLAKGSKERGADVCVVSSGGIYEEKLKELGIKHYQIYDLECKNPKIMLQTLKKILKIVRKEKIDIIHTHHRMAALYGWFIKKIFSHIKLVYTAHNVFYNRKVLTKISLMNSNIVAVGESVKKNLIDIFGINEKRITTIYNAVQIEEVKEENYNQVLKDLKVKNCKLVGIIGRLSEQKGVDIFLHTIAELHKEMPNLKGIVIGTGEDAEMLQRLAKELSIEKDIIFLGYQEHITALIEQLDLVVMPSRWEGFPLTPIEVFAMKKTIVASNIEGINEIVKNNNNGILCKKDDVQAFSEAIKKLLNENDEKIRLETNGNEYYEGHFNYAGFIKSYQSLYKRVASKE